MRENKKELEWEWNHVIICTSPNASTTFLSCMFAANSRIVEYVCTEGKNAIKKAYQFTFHAFIKM